MVAGHTVTGTGISGSVTVASVSGVALVLSAPVTLADATTLTFAITGAVNGAVSSSTAVRHRLCLVCSTAVRG